MTENESKIQTLYKRFLNREKDAIIEITSTYKTSLIIFINSVVHNTEIAEDLASETFATLLIKRPKIKNVIYFKTYLFTIGKNLALTYIKKNQKLTYLTKEQEVFFDPDEFLIQDERKLIILKCINQLNNEYREILFLRYWEDLSILEIAKITKKSRKQMYNLLARAKDGLKILLYKEGFTYED